jgi:GTPase involved in cell partitioning and DNA repair
MYKVAEFNNKGAQLENIIKKLEIENLSLKEDINLVKKELSMYKNTLEKTKTVLFISEADNIKIDWSSEEDVYFKEMLGEDLMHCLDIENLNFIKFIHPDDRALIIEKTLYFMKNRGDNFR